MHALLVRHAGDQKSKQSLLHGLLQGSSIIGAKPSCIGHHKDVDTSSGLASIILPSLSKIRSCKIEVGLGHNQQAVHPRVLHVPVLDMHFPFREDEGCQRSFLSLCRAHDCPPDSLSHC